ncbi:hypothetical protein [Flavobacterium sp. HNIBRBA15423]|uniref:hypothetical protein n=1 Tax=Flavobacterium sp. HNIBRBA15423 TaxID=3458683 RepID=UPI004043BECA
MLYLKSNDNLLKGFVFGRSGYEIKGFYLHVFVQPLYLLDENINLTFGYKIKYDSKDFWEIDDKKDNTKLFIELEKAINKNSNDFLKIFDSPESFYKYYQNKCVNLRMVEAVVLSACYSLSEERFSLIDKYISILEKEDLSINWRKTLLEQARLLKLNITDEKKIKKDIT